MQADWDAQRCGEFYEWLRNRRIQRRNKFMPSHCRAEMVVQNISVILRIVAPFLAFKTSLYVFSSSL